MKYKISCSIISNIGGRNVNEDSVGFYQGNNGSGFILCDGLGGHGMGDKASQLVVDVFKSEFEKMVRPSEMLSNTFIAAQEILLTEQRALCAEKKMKTTAVSVVMDEKKAYVGHIGDSRLYVFYKGKILIRTLDHSIPQMLVETREIQENEIRNHPDRSKLLKVMGIPWEGPAADFMKPIPLKKCQAFLLCSDGFWELIDENEMCETLNRSASVQEWLGLMNELVQRRGNNICMDNNSAIAIWCSKV